MHFSKSWIEISKKSLFSNLFFLKRMIGKDVKICAVVKANAYGHGMKEIVLLLKNKVNFFAVDSLNEALEIRGLGVSTPILVMGYIQECFLKEAIKNDISFVVYNKSSIDKIKSLVINKKAKIHLKLETGLNRQGIKNSELTRFVKNILSIKEKFVIEGAYTHFANIEDTLDSSFALNQIVEFKKQLSLIKKLGVRIPIIHCSASAGSLLYPDFNFNMVRIGIGLYGLWPSRETAIAFGLRREKGNLKPVLTWKSLVAQVKFIDVGESVGYGRTWYAGRRSKIAVIPIGYSDGFDRKLSNNARIIIAGQSCPVIGRIAMNMIMIDVTEVEKIKEGDCVTILGKDGREVISADEIANRINTINYEIVTRINPSLPRIVKL